MLTLFISNRHRQGMLTLFISNRHRQGMLTLFISNRHRQGMLTLFISNNNFQTSNSACAQMAKLLMSGLVLVYMGILQTGGSVYSVALGVLCSIAHAWDMPCIGFSMASLNHVVVLQAHRCNGKYDTTY